MHNKTKENIKTNAKRKRKRKFFRSCNNVLRSRCEKTSTVMFLVGSHYVQKWMRRRDHLMLHTEIPCNDGNWCKFIFETEKVKKAYTLKQAYRLLKSPKRCIAYRLHCKRHKLFFSLSNGSFHWIQKALNSHSNLLFGNWNEMNVVHHINWRTWYCQIHANSTICQVIKNVTVKIVIDFSRHLLTCRFVSLPLQPIFDSFKLKINFLLLLSIVPETNQNYCPLKNRIMN